MLVNKFGNWSINDRNIKKQRRETKMRKQRIKRMYTVNHKNVTLCL